MVRRSVVWRSRSARTGTRRRVPRNTIIWLNCGDVGGVNLPVRDGNQPFLRKGGRCGEWPAAGCLLRRAILECQSAAGRPRGIGGGRRCYFCYDAPCVTACPTAIDIPPFNRQISNGRPKAAVRTILDESIFGGMCARVCPTDTLCEGACVREVAVGKPVEIGRLQRFPTDALMAERGQSYTRDTPSGRKLAVEGAGPAGLSCAQWMAVKGHDMVVFDGPTKPGGLNEYGNAAYKATGTSRNGRSIGCWISARSRPAVKAGWVAKYRWNSFVRIMALSFWA